VELEIDETTRHVETEPASLIHQSHVAFLLLIPFQTLRGYARAVFRGRPSYRLQDAAAGRCRLILAPLGLISIGNRQTGGRRYVGLV